MTESFLVGGGGGSNCRYAQLHMKTLISPTIKFRVEIECEVGGACHGVSSVQGRIVGPVGLGVYIHRSMVVCHLSVCITLLLAQWSGRQTNTWQLRGSIPGVDKILSDDLHGPGTQKKLARRSLCAQKSMHDC